MKEEINVPLPFQAAYPDQAGDACRGELSTPSCSWGRANSNPLSESKALQSRARSQVRVREPVPVTLPLPQCGAPLPEGRSPLQGALGGRPMGHQKVSVFLRL